MSKEKGARKPRGRWVRRLVGWLVALALLGAAGAYGYFSLKKEYTVTYDSYTAARGSISNALSFSGNLALIDSASYAATADGTVRKVSVAAGDSVKAGDALIRLSGGQTVKADFSGTVNALDVQEGDSVSVGDSLVQVADMTHLKASLRVSEYDISDIAVGTACSVAVTATEQTFESTIAAIDHISASGGSVAYYTATVYVDVDPGSGVYPGMQVTVTVPKEEADDVIILKMDALSFDAANSAFVYMKGDNGVLAQVPVEVGVSNGSYVEISSGLKEGDEVYVESKEEDSAGGLSGLFSGLFGSQQFNAPAGGYNRGNRNFSGDNYPGGGNNSGSGRSASGGAGSGSTSRGSGQNGGGRS